MLTIKPFAELSTIIPASFLQFFVIMMVLLIIVGTGLDMLHKKNVVYFFRNAQKAKKSAKTELSTGKKTAVILKTVTSDIATTSELGFGKRRLAIKESSYFIPGHGGVFDRMDSIIGGILGYSLILYIDFGLNFY